MLVNVGSASENSLNDLLQQAMQFQNSGDLAMAENMYRLVIEQAPKNVEALHQLSILLYNTGNYDDVERLARKVIELKSDHDEAYNTLGLILKKQAQEEDAKSAYIKAIEINPSGHIAYYVNLLELLEQMSLLDEAAQWLEKGKNSFPKEPSLSLYEAFLEKRRGNLECAIEILEATKAGRDEGLALDVRHELGLLYDRTNQPDKAFQCFTFVNKAFKKVAKQKNISATLIPDRIKQFQDVCTGEWLKSWNEAPRNEETSPVFLVGFPRSGTTLLGHIMSVHSDVYTAQEVPIIEKLQVYLEENLPGYPSALSDLPSEHINNLRQSYYDLHRKHSSWKTEKVFIDKIPLNYTAAGLIHRIFPDSKFIFIKRHPCDCVLSCFMQKFIVNAQNVHFLNLDDAAKLYTQSMELWKQYEESLPIQVHYISYEDLVSAPEKELRAALEFLDLPWDEALLNYHGVRSKNHSIRTPSYSQITEELYDSAKFRWHNYNRQIGPVLERLAPYIERLGY